MRLFSNRAGLAAIWALSASALSIQVQAEQHASAPSVTPVGKTVQVTGGGMSPREVVSVRVTSPTGQVSILATVADRKGGFAQAVTPATAGTYRVELLSGNNQRFADLRVVAAGQ